MAELDASIYGKLQTPTIQMPDIGAAQERGLRLSTLGLQQAQLGYQLGVQNAVRQAASSSTDPNGQFNRGAFLSNLSKVAPVAAIDYQNQFNQQDKAAAEAKLAQMQSAHQTLSVTTPALQYLLGLSDNEASQAFPSVMAQLKAQGVPMTNAPSSWDRGWANQGYQIGMRMKEGLENQKIASEINVEKYGPRSPNAELTSQYDKQVGTIRGSQIAMAQMLDNYKNPSPQGDASLILNAFKIKFPTAPDVNSLAELSTAQSVPDKWKQMAAHALEGGLDDSTRNNLMRDGISTYRANYNTWKDLQKRTQARQVYQGVTDPTMTFEPAIENTYAEAMGIQKDIGPYVPTSKRGGITGTAAKIMGAVTGVNSANATPSRPMIKAGAVEDGYVFMGGDPGKQSSWKKVK